MAKRGHCARWVTLWAWGIGAGILSWGCSSSSESEGETTNPKVDAAVGDAAISSDARQESGTDTGGNSDVFDEWPPDALPDAFSDIVSEVSSGCGNGVCDPGEDYGNCAVDCGQCPPTCGNGVCDPGEDCGNCPQDCGSCSEADDLFKCIFDPMQWWKGADKRDITFVGFGDPHAADPSPGCSVNKNDAPNQNLLIRQAINSIGTHVWPKGASFAQEDKPYSHVRGVIIAGDLTQTGSESVPAGQAVCRQYTVYREAFGRCGTENKLSFPVYDLYGNHDFPRAALPGNPDHHPVIDYLDRITQAHRPGDAKDLYDDATPGTGHYAWRWDDIWFVNVNVKPGWKAENLPNETNTNVRIVDPHDSRRFLKEFLLSRKNSAKRQIVITAHYGLGSLDAEEKESFCKLIHHAQHGTGSFEGIGKKLSPNWPVLAYIHGHNHHRPEHKEFPCPSPYQDIIIPTFSLGTPFYQGPHNVQGQLHFTIMRIGANKLEVVGVSAPANNPTGPWDYLYRIRLGYPVQP
ncbi:MAG TPA: hypothetical protein PKL24_02480 [Polyangiaceae bacterium]|nr:MAG: hypothetical protein BWY17_00391 [Deltaproteobacteria bacterium ADurb.Bin207]HNZ20979.1 hypothetical protein [Polyangiaceae bacterium]HOD23872.1 hypothetical protein [Polyangiaceae bacterium]HOE48859.1 hypothetical protein [Polyangiaceae bacterium]HOG98849.1 hypothetical protein [Polyangiaceae bacterium]